MPAHFQRDLDALKSQLLDMARLAETAVSRAVAAFQTADSALAGSVIADDSRLDALEKEIDDRAIQLLACAPLASDLRLVTVAMKICHNLERVGDEASTIARQVVELGAAPRPETGGRLPKMAEQALGMLHRALDAFVSGQSAAARAIIPEDKVIDSANRELHTELRALMVAKQAGVTACLNVMTTSKSLERIGDHAKNIAEEVVFLHEGRDIRHATAR